ncbi:MAG: LysM peptidoglycan-binding domain-containing protein [Deltaproteobacteria bacterium]|nr:MAG: LysM peptidoglycan-binding domain-containing protein [Deltaproteobacteria bacterium]
MRTYFFLLLIFSCQIFAQDTVEIDLVEPNDIEVLLNEDTGGDQVSKALDDLDALKEDIGDAPKVEPKKVEKTKKIKEPAFFDVGKEEKQLLELSKFVQTKITAKEWDDIAKEAKSEKYVVQDGEWLWQISKKLFGTGFYYSKIWSMNPHIKNPHEITPGMVLIFDTGDEDSLPEVQIGKFLDSKTRARKRTGQTIDLEDFGDDISPKWIEDRKNLVEQGVYFQFASDETYEDLERMGKMALRKDYQKYEPPIAEIVIVEPGEQYDRSGFDKTSKIIFSYKEGFFLNSFITTNIVEDLGKINAIQGDRSFIHRWDKIYVQFDETVKPRPGDKFSIYSRDGNRSHPVSDREGMRYTILAQIEVLRRVGGVWECNVLEVTDLVKRGDRVTVYTPKIEKIIQTFTNRKIEAAIIDAYTDTVGGLSFGNVVYLDRGRADGVEMGTVFEIFSFKDAGTGRKISNDPTFKIGELTVITLTENFSTALITLSSMEISLGLLSFSKTLDSVAKVNKDRKAISLGKVDRIKAEELDNLDIELNLDDVSEDLLDEADSIKLTDDELEELEGQEREKSIIKEHEKDLKELERLEQEILDAESDLFERQRDEDKLLEDIDLGQFEDMTGEKKPTLENVDEIEKEIGIKYIDQEIDAKDNPYGLTEFDLEEIDRLLNTGSN